MASPSYSSATNEIYAGRFKKVAHVFLESGQSNCQGVAPITDTPIADNVLVGNVKTWRRNINGGTMYSGTGAWYDLEYDTNQYEGRNQFGSVLKFAMNLRDNLEDENNDIYIIKADGNGKAIAGWINGGAEAVAMYSGHFTPALASLVAMRDAGSYNEIHIHGMFWDQGEQDCKTEALANAYQSKLEEFISDVRAAVGIANLPFVIRRMELDNENHQYTSILAAAQEAVAASDSKISLISGPWVYLPDDTHLDGASQNSVGDQRYTLLTSMTSGIIYNG